jgi:hypothetical protein
MESQQLILGYATVVLKQRSFRKNHFDDRINTLHTFQ